MNHTRQFCMFLFQKMACAPTVVGLKSETGIPQVKQYMLAWVIWSVPIKGLLCFPWSGPFTLRYNDKQYFAC